MLFLIHSLFTLIHQYSMCVLYFCGPEHFSTLLLIYLHFLYSFILPANILVTNLLQL